MQEAWDHREVGSFLAWNLASSEGIDGSWRQLKESVGWTRMQRYLTKHKHDGKVDVLLEEPPQHQIWGLKWDGQEASAGPFQDQIWGLELGGQEASDGQAASVALEGQEKPVQKDQLNLEGFNSEKVWLLAEAKIWDLKLGIRKHQVMKLKEKVALLKVALIVDVKYCGECEERLEGASMPIKRKAGWIRVQRYKKKQNHAKKVEALLGRWMHD